MFRFILGVVLGEKSIFVGPAEVINFNHMSSLCLFCVHTKGKQCMDGHKTSNDNIGLNQNFLPFVVMVWTLQGVWWNLSYEHQHVSNEIEIQPGSSNIETDLCLTSVFSPWYAPLISLDGDYAKFPIFSCLHILQGWAPRPAGRGGFPAPPRPVKMIKTAGKLRGKIKARISNFSNRGKQYDGTISQQ